MPDSFAPRISVLLTLVLLALCSPASADELGSLTGQFTLPGKLPEPRMIPGEFGKLVPDESLLVDPESHGIANILVTLHLRPGDKVPSAPKLDPMPVRLKMVNHRFEPRIVLVRAGQNLVIENVDRDIRNAKCDLPTNASFNIALDRGRSREVELKHSEKLPGSLFNTIDPSMRGFLVVTDHPYAAVTDRSGRFEMTGLPPGEWTFRAWHERDGYVETVELEGKVTTWPRGQFARKIAGRKNDLGAIQVAKEEMKSRD
jgi:hypothetical protein